ncbi:unnamed protein product [Sphenostylis stenocarpa]|uniref:Uncharacterized protein n=1 Tax=Sphenostylis stenocarpa TaxID=92480 RepID=A0AA86TBL9_9FABA|nr:unnamed protein product [Sphenostylis stenocarpa]
MARETELLRRKRGYNVGAKFSVGNKQCESRRTRVTRSGFITFVGSKTLKRWLSCSPESVKKKRRNVVMMRRGGHWEFGEMDEMRKGKSTKIYDPHTAALTVVDYDPMYA